MRIPLAGIIERQAFGGPRALFLVRFEKPLKAKGIDQAISRRLGPGMGPEMRMWTGMFKAAREAGFSAPGMAITAMWARWQDISLDVNRAKRGQRVELAFIGGAGSGTGKVPVLTGQFAGSRRFGGRGYKTSSGRYPPARYETAALIALDEPIHYAEARSVVDGSARYEDTRRRILPEHAIRRAYLVPTVSTIPDHIWRDIEKTAFGDMPDHVAKKVVDASRYARQPGRYIIEMNARLKKVALTIRRRLHPYRRVSKLLDIGEFLFREIEPTPMAEFRRIMRVWYKVTMPRYNPHERVRLMWEAILWSSHLFVWPIVKRELFRDPQYGDVALRPMREDLAEYLEVEAAEAARGVR
jgi:hypothetical protein